MTLEETVNKAAEVLVDGWSIVISVEKDSASVEAVRPDGTRVQMDDGEADLQEQVSSAIALAKDEDESNNLGTPLWKIFGKP
jgi:hypothetical protein